jgi:hypothetical protein
LQKRMLAPTDMTMQAPLEFQWNVIEKNLKATG